MARRSGRKERLVSALSLAAGALLLLLLQHFEAHALELTPLPAMQPYPPLRPFDTVYPANIPTGLPAELPPPPSPLSPGPTPAAACGTTVGAVLARHNRNGLATFLAQSALGRQVLSGALAATVLAPPDGALAAALPASSSGAAAAAGLASYHVLQGSLSLAQLSSGRRRNTSLVQAYCPTALQTVTLLSGSPDALSDPITFVRSADTTARIVSGDHAACNSVVHLLDGALQPCCSSLFSQAQLGQFSIVQIQPSYFDGYKAQPPPDNSDASNRRLFEEALVDLLLFSSPMNKSRTILWPSAAAWSGISLAQLLPGTELSSVALRTQALRILALYAISYQDSILPKDIPGPDGRAPAVTFPWRPALRNFTSDTAWSCEDAASVTAPALTQPTPPVSVPLPNFTSPAPALPKVSPSLLPPPAAPLVPSPSPGLVPELLPPPAATNATSGNASGGAAGNASSSPGLPASSPAVVVLPPPPPAAAAASPSPALGVPAASPPAVAPAPAGSPAVPPAVPPAANTSSGPAGGGGGGARRLTAAVGGASKSARVLAAYESCEGTRVLIVDTVLVPCGFDGLLARYSELARAVDGGRTSSLPLPTSLAASYYTWLVQTGAIKPAAASGVGVGLGTKSAAGSVVCGNHLLLGAAALAAAAAAAAV